jgi:hypothetical protein
METFLSNDGIEWVKIDKENNEFLCMPKHLFEEKQLIAEGNTPLPADEGTQ